MNWHWSMVQNVSSIHINLEPTVISHSTRRHWIIEILLHIVAKEINNIFYLRSIILLPKMLACSCSHLSSERTLWQADKSTLFYQQEANISSLGECIYLSTHVLALYFLVSHHKNLYRTHIVQTKPWTELLKFLFNLRHLLSAPLCQALCLDSGESEMHRCCFILIG